MGAGQTASEAESVTPVKSNPIYLEPSGELYRRNRSPLSASRHRYVNLKLQESILESAHRNQHTGRSSKWLRFQIHLQRANQPTVSLPARSMSSPSPVPNGIAGAGTAKRSSPICSTVRSIPMLSASRPTQSSPSYPSSCCFTLFLVLYFIPT